MSVWPVVIIPPSIRRGLEQQPTQKSQRLPSGIKSYYIATLSTVSNFALPFDHRLAPTGNSRLFFGFTRLLTTPDRSGQPWVTLT